MRYDKYMLGCVFVSHMCMYSCYIQHFHNKINTKESVNQNLITQLAACTIMYNSTPPLGARPKIYGSEDSKRKPCAQP